MIRWIALCFLLVPLVVSASPVPWKATASWYGPEFHGRRTANGERFDQNALTAAHKALPFGTEVRVTNLHTQQSVVVRINDRGPYIRGREIDLSKAAAERIGMAATGVGVVRLEVKKWGKSEKDQNQVPKMRSRLYCI